MHSEIERVGRESIRSEPRAPTTYQSACFGSAYRADFAPVRHEIETLRVDAINYHVKVQTRFLRSYQGVQTMQRPGPPPAQMSVAVHGLGILHAMLPQHLSVAPFDRHRPDRGCSDGDNAEVMT